VHGSLPVAENEPGEHGPAVAARIPGAVDIWIDGSAPAGSVVADTAASAGLTDTARLALRTANATRTVIAVRTLALRTVTMLPPLAGAATGHDLPAKTRLVGSVGQRARQLRVTWRARPEDPRLASTVTSGSVGYNICSAAQVPQQQCLDC